MFLDRLKYLVFEPRKALFGQLTLYFLGLAALIYLVLQGTGDLLTTRTEVVETSAFGAPQVQQVARWQPSKENVAFLLFSLITVILLTIPMTWVYRGTRRKRDLDQSIVETVLILPIIVVGIIMIVQDNLALAFSLAGIFAGVQFRSRLNEIADAHYLFASIGLSLAAGVGAWHIAYLLSLFFCFGVYTFWRIGYATESGDRHTRLPGEKAEGDKNGNGKNGKKPPETEPETGPKPVRPGEADDLLL